jgi:hypothetical protein
VAPQSESSEQTNPERVEQRRAGRQRRQQNAPQSQPAADSEQSQPAPAQADGEPAGHDDGSPRGSARHDHERPSRPHREQPTGSAGNKERQQGAGQPSEREERRRTRRGSASRAGGSAGGSGAAVTTTPASGSTSTGASTHAVPPAPATSASAPAIPASTPSAGVSSPVAPQSSATVVAAGTTPQPAGGPGRSVAVKRTHRAARRSRRGRAGVAGRGLGSAASLPGAALAAAAGPGARARTVPAGHARGAPRIRPVTGRPSPLVRTITTIVDVVPLPIRIVIGLLFALALALAARSQLEGLRARRLERQRGQLLEDVGLLQAALLPVLPARLGPVGTSAAYRPADGPAAGGDFYDVFALEDGRLGAIVGDLSGHGRQALPHTALVRFTVRAYLEAGLAPRDAVQTAGAVLEHQLGESFATLVAATYHPRERVLAYACAGHPPPLVLGSESIVPVTVCSAPPIGAGMRTGTRQTVVALPGRAEVCLHTDGLTEARVGSGPLGSAGSGLPRDSAGSRLQRGSAGSESPHGLAGAEPYGPGLYGTERLARALTGLGPHPSATALLDRVAGETVARPDDMAACLLSVEGGAAAPRVLLEELELDREQAAGDRGERFLLACGVAPREAAALAQSARLAADSAGSVVLELRPTDGAPDVALRVNNVAPLRSSIARRHAALGGAR